jgi:hypothetical protein
VSRGGGRHRGREERGEGGGGGEGEGVKMRGRGGWEVGITARSPKTRSRVPPFGTSLGIAQTVRRAPTPPRSPGPDRRKRRLTKTTKMREGRYIRQTPRRMDAAPTGGTQPRDPGPHSVDTADCVRGGGGAIPQSTWQHESD